MSKHFVSITRITNIAKILIVIFIKSSHFPFFHSYLLGAANLEMHIIRVAFFSMPADAIQQATFHKDVRNVFQKNVTNYRHDGISHSRSKLLISSVRSQQLIYTISMGWGICSLWRSVPDHMEAHTLHLSDVEVEFPFQPYPCQLSYMEKVIQALQNVSKSSNSDLRCF